MPVVERDRDAADAVQVVSSGRVEPHEGIEQAVYYGLGDEVSAVERVEAGRVARQAKAKCDLAAAVSLRAAAGTAGKSQ